MDPTNINTLIGIIGAIIGIAGIVVTIISFVRRKTITISTKTKLYINPCEKGAFVFDYSNNNGQYTIGTKENTLIQNGQKQVILVFMHIKMVKEWNPLH